MAMFRTAAALSVLSAASAGDVVPTADISATSKLGNRILSSARRLDDNQFTWVTGYSLKFHKCATSDEYFGGFGGDNDNNNNRNFNGMYKQRLVHFKLCPSDDCDSCKNGADYVIDMNMYVEAYLESKLEAQEYNCEMVQENCNCDNANDDEACERNCYYEAGLDYCEDNNNNNNQNQNQIEFNLEEAAECRELEVDDEALQYYYYQQNGNGNNQYYNQQQQGGQEMQLFMGPYCSANGKYIHLGVFMDEMCSYAAPDGTYEKFSYGQAMPYSTESLIDAECVSCKEPQDADDQNNGDQGDEDEVLEVCERLYEDAGKCESGLTEGTTYYPNTYACDFIQTLKAPGKMAGASKGSSVSASKVFAGLFAATTVLFAGVAYFLYQKAKRQNVHLSGQDGGAMA